MQVRNPPKVGRERRKLKQAVGSSQKGVSPGEKALGARGAVVLHFEDRRQVVREITQSFFVFSWMV